METCLVVLSTTVRLDRRQALRTVICTQWLILSMKRGGDTCFLRKGSFRSSTLVVFSSFLHCHSVRLLYAIVYFFHINEPSRKSTSLWFARSLTAACSSRDETSASFIPFNGKQKTSNYFCSASRNQSPSAYLYRRNRVEVTLQLQSHNPSLRL